MNLYRKYMDTKAEHPDCLVLIKAGDFYEAVADDAKIVADALGLVLTRTIDGIPMSGFMVARADEYLHKLIGAGHKVFIADWAAA